MKSIRYLLYNLAAVMLFILVSHGAKANSFYGCQQFCSQQMKQRMGGRTDAATSRAAFRFYENCMAQTQREGRCGGTTNRSRTPTNAPTKNTAGSPQAGGTNSPAAAPVAQQQNVSGNTAAAANTPGPQQQQQTENTNRQGSYDPTNTAAQLATYCASRINAMVTVCDNKNEVALTECDPEQNEEMNATMDTIGTISGVLGTATGSSIAAACSKAASISQAAGAAVAAYRITCNNDKNTCIKSCQDGMTSFERCMRESAANAMTVPSLTTQNLQDALSNNSVYQKLAESRNQCRAMDTKIKQAEQAIMNFMATSANASQCKNLTSSSVPSYCQQNPTAAGCSQAVTDCSSPTNASSLVCICQSNKNDPRCGGSASNKIGIDNQNSGSRSVASKGAKIDGDFGASGGMAFPEGTNLNSRNSKDNSQNGGAPSLGSDAGGGPGASDPEGSGSSGSAGPDVLSGYFGSGSGGGFAGDGGAGSLGASDFNSDVYSGLSRGTGEQGPNLSDFLPGEALDPMAMSGDALPGGLLGPNVNIWHKINLRYQVVEPTLLKD